MFRLAKVCHMTPVDIGETPFPEFLILDSTAEEWLNMEAKHPRL